MKADGGKDDPARLYIPACLKCEKVAYATRRAARAVLKRHKETPGREVKAGKLKVYRCPHGNGFHLGHDQQYGGVS